MHRRFQNGGVTVLLCTFKISRGAVDCVINERWTPTRGQPVGDYLDAIGSSYRFAVAKDLETEPMRCVVIASKSGFAMLPVVDGTVRHCTVGGRLSDRIPLQMYKQLILQITGKS